MTTPTRLFTVCCLLFFIRPGVSFGQGLPTATPDELGFSAERLARIDAHLEAQIDAGRLPGAVALVVRDGNVVYFKAFGLADLESGEPMEADAIFRLASMTKPIVSVAAMMLYEEGHFLLNDPVSRYIAEFEDPEVLVDIDLEDTTYTTEPARRDVTIRDLLAHTSGIGQGIFNDTLGAVYRKADVPEGFDVREITIGQKMRILADLPLLHHPGARFTYGLSADMLGYLVEVVSGVPLDRFLQERIFEPLKMRDTHFYLPEEQAMRLAPLYGSADGGQLKRVDQQMMDRIVPHTSPHYPVDAAGTYFSGGSGLSSTAADYARFAQMLLNGGVLEGVRLLSPKTVELMTVNHVGEHDVFWPGGTGFGLGFWVTTDLAHVGELTSAGTYGWGGYWNTRFWVDPAEDLVGVFMAQVHQSSYNHRRFQVQVYQALTERRSSRLASVSE